MRPQHRALNLLFALLSACGARSTLDAPRDAGVEDAGVEQEDAALSCPSCSQRGWACAGPRNHACCDAPCVYAERGLTHGWFCGGVIARGNEVPCAPPQPGCQLVELSGCGTHGPIVDVCTSGLSARQLRRCDGTCFEPDEFYRTHWVRSCDHAPDGGCAADDGCGPIWDAVYCCP